MFRSVDGIKPKTPFGYDLGAIKGDRGVEGYRDDKQGVIGQKIKF